MTVTIDTLNGDEVLAAIDDLAALRMTVFARWPYLYDGDVGYEADYLREFVEAPSAVLVAARDDGRIVGAATGSPMAAQKAQFRAPFAARGLDVESLFYFGESVLLPEYRGQGIGHAFFDHREAQARRCGAQAATFAVVIRPLDHPDRPADYRPLGPFWQKRGYEPVEGFVTEFAWKDHRDEGDTPKPMQYWLRRL
ncbi:MULTISPECIES: GNAT family N-acetyltransferase [unclassified Novosphingobium]|uniref:GNAT family N-acetyltransferase n=1 Tax=unclassified Novosphingobium TaxID=2644732 RepID=UPI0013583E9E|nr:MULTISPECIES: GNAT family N-acetyltransferase [unclassified Novosphingobium]